MNCRKKNIVIVVGTRPEVIKMARVYFVLSESPKFSVTLVSTAQHRQMLDQAMSIFGLKADYDMDVMRPNQTLTSLTARVLNEWGKFFKDNHPDAILVQGDTTTVLSTALAAFYQHIPIGHVEAGLRTGDLYSPFPEEMNRKLTDPISRWCFAPTQESKQNLLKEGIEQEKCFVTGNTVIDSLYWMRNKLHQNNITPEIITKKYAIPESFYEEFFKKGKRWILVTGHRRENFGKKLEDICLALKEIVRKYQDVGLIYPVHLNPNVQHTVNNILKGHDRIALIPPVDYEDFIWLMSNCFFVISDSGGVQEEAPSFGKPVLVMRETTERPEGVAAGTCELVGSDRDKILSAASKLIEDKDEYVRRSKLRNPYGDGNAAIAIREILEREL